MRSKYKVGIVSDLVLANCGKCRTMLPDMKRVNSREFQKKFSELNKNLKPGQSVEITYHGKPVATYTKRTTRRIQTPNFLSFLKNDPKVGDQILKKYYDSLS